MPTPNFSWERSIIDAALAKAIPGTTIPPYALGYHRSGHTMGMFYTKIRSTFGHFTLFGPKITFNQYAWAKQPEPTKLLVLRHEAMHYACAILHGKVREPHGFQWSHLMRSIGEEPRPCLTAEATTAMHAAMRPHYVRAFCQCAGHLFPPGTRLYHAKNRGGGPRWACNLCRAHLTRDPQPWAVRPTSLAISPNNSRLRGAA